MESSSSNKNVLWLSLAGLGLLGAIVVYAVNNTSPPPADPIATPTATRSTAPARANTVTLPAGTGISMTLQTALSTKTASVGDRFTARVNSPVMVAGRTVIPAGADVSGHVALTEQPGKASGRGKMQLSYDTVRYGGRTYELASVGRVYESESGRGKDAAIIGGGAVAGGVVGAIIGGSAGDAGKGAAAGAVAGTAASLLTRGPQLQLEAGTVIEVSLDNPVVVRPAATS
jgi:ferric-dicitrate binding protein FerR (iron transport regulator)